MISFRLAETISRLRNIVNVSQFFCQGETGEQGKEGIDGKAGIDVSLSSCHCSEMMKIYILW